MAELYDLTLNGVTYDSFPDKEAREQLAEVERDMLALEDDGVGNIRFAKSTASDEPDEPAEPVYKTVTVESTANEQGGHILELSGIDVGTELAVETTGSKVYCGGANWFSQSEFTVSAGNCTKTDEGFSVTHYATLQLPFSLPAGIYALSADLTLSDGSKPADKTGADLPASWRYESYADPIRAGSVWAATAPFSQITLYAGSSASAANGKTITFDKVCIRSIPALAVTGNFYYAGDYNGVIYNVANGENPIVASDPMYLFADGGAEVSVSYQREVVVEDTPDEPETTDSIVDAGELQSLTIENRQYKSFPDDDARTRVGAVEKRIVKTATVSSTVDRYNAHIAVLEDVPENTELTVETTGSKVFCGGRNWFPETDFSVTRNKIVTLAVPLPAGRYIISTAAELGSAETPTVQVSNASGTRISCSDAECTKDTSTGLLARACKDGTRYTVEFYVKEPIAKIAIFSANNNSSSNGVTTVFSDFCVVRVPVDAVLFAGDYEYAGDYTGVVYAAGEKPVVTSGPMYIFAADHSEITASYTEDAFSGVSTTTENVALPNEYYFEGDYLSNKAATINALIEETAINGDAFIFITDQHLNGGCNAGQTPLLIKYLSDNTKVRKLFSGGDVGTAKDHFTTYVEQMASAFAGNIHYAMGNHEYDLSAGGIKNATEAELYYAFGINKPNQIGNPARHYYYVDNPQQKMRYVVVNNNMHKADVTTTATGVTASDVTAQAEWLTNTAFDVGEGWGIVVFCHKFFNPPENGNTIDASATTFQTAIDNYDGDGEIIAVFHGHTHRDMVNHTAGGVPVISTTSDKHQWLSTDGVVEDFFEYRRYGTTTEHAFDVVIVDRTERKLYCVRIGAPAVDDNGADNTKLVETRVVDFRSAT